MLNRRQYFSRGTCTQLLGVSLLIFAVGVFIFALGVWGHELVLVTVGLALSYAPFGVLYHWLIGPSWPDSKFAFSTGRPAKAISAFPVPSLAVRPATPPPRRLLAS